MKLIFNVFIPITALISNGGNTFSNVSKEMYNSLQHTHRLMVSVSILCLLIGFSLSYVAFIRIKHARVSQERLLLLMKELQHRTTNNYMVLSSILRLQIDRVGTEEVLISAATRLDAMNAVNNLLFKAENTNGIKLKVLISQLVSNVAYSYKGNADSIELDISDDATVAQGKAILIGLIINELLSNLFKHSTFTAQAQVLIAYNETREMCTLLIKDNLGYWSVDSSIDRKKGLGLFLIDQLVKQLDGSLEINSDANGSERRIEFTNKTA